MPAVTSLEALNHAADSFEVTDITLAIEPSAREAVQRSLEDSGLLLLGEVHGVRENPLVIRALLQAFGVNQLALEWPAELTPLIDAYIQGAALKDHPALWLGDGRITAGHLAVLRDRAKAGPFGLILFDQIMRSTSTWSERDEAMAGPVLASCEANGTTLVVAGNAHTPTRPTAPDPQDRTRKTGPVRPDPQGRTRKAGPPQVGRSISAPNGAAACRPQAKAIESTEGSVGIVAAIAREVSASGSIANYRAPGRRTGSDREAAVALPRS